MTAGSFPRKPPEPMPGSLNRRRHRPLSRVGIFGGTFDPPHRAHLAVALAALRQLNLDVLYLVPARTSPLKRHRTTAGMRHRAAMVRLLAGKDRRLRLSLMEFRRPGMSFTVETVRAFRKRHPHAELFLLIGEDNLRTFHRWHHPAAILGLATLAVYPRRGTGSRDGRGNRRVPCRMLNGRFDDLSSSEIREERRRGNERRDALLPSVNSYIRRHGLYGADRPGNG
jgi:nicotinate-nucleotide adenylyltransferase